MSFKAAIESPESIVFVEAPDGYPIELIEKAL